MDKTKRIGQYRQFSFGGEKYQAYIPNPLPPEPPLDMDSIYPLLDKANHALGRLDGMSLVLPDLQIFMYMYVRKEAVLSSQIEGTQSTLSELLQYENENIPGVPLDDVVEVSNYVKALNYGMDRLNELPLSSRLLKEIHKILLTSGRGSKKQPGEIRASQNWIEGTRPGNARFVPPPPDEVLDCFAELDKFLNDESVRLPALIKAALAHVQFETIHPFQDGNGRVGRLLILLILFAEGVIRQPLLYLSLYFKTHRRAYYDHLQMVRETGDWEAWIEFFLTAVTETANQATETAQKIIALFNEDRAKIENSKNSTATVLHLHDYFQRKIYSKTGQIRNALNVSLPTTLRALKALEELGIVTETTGKDRHKEFVYSQYLEILIV